MSPAPLAELLRRCPSAACVYLWLVAKYDGRPIFANRKRIAAEMGIKKHGTVTKALQALQDLKFLKYRARCKASADGKCLQRYLQISLGKDRLNGFWVGASSFGKSRSNGLSVNGASFGKSRLKVPISLRERASESEPSAPLVASVDNPLGNQEEPRLSPEEHETVLRRLREESA